MFLSPWQRFLSSLSPKGRRKTRRQTLRRLSIERFEDRLTPAVHDLTTPGTFSTIQAAVNAANPGDTILADPGTYNELVQVTKTLTIEGAQHGVGAQNGRPGAMESIVSNGDGDFQIEADNVTIDGFTLQGVVNNPSSPPFTGLGAAIWTNPGFSGTHGGHVIVNNIIQGNISGIELANDGTFETTVQFNLIQNNNSPGAGSGSGIRDDFSLQKALIDSNTISNNSNAGVTLQGSPQSGITISQNTMDSNGNAVSLFNTASSSITRNTISTSTASQISIGGGDSNIQITGNLIQNGSAGGIRVCI
jgi:parallel beta-helix repeat protein